MEAFVTYIYGGSQKYIMINLFWATSILINNIWYKNSFSFFWMNGNKFWKIRILYVY